MAFYSPVAAALSAHGFLTSAINEVKDASMLMEDNEHLKSLKKDARIIGSSLYFIDDFLLSILHIHASTANRLEIHVAPVDLLRDVFKPVCSILHQRNSPVYLELDCPDNLVVMTDCLRLKQVRTSKLMKGL